MLPGATEACDGIDANCDPTDLSEVDADGDGHLACDECDDTRASIYPGAVEVCADGLDQDCSGADLPCDVAGDPDPDSGGGGDGGGKDGGCGCHGGGRAPIGPGGLALTLALLMARRRLA